jgi:hypothetical protein
MCCCMRLSIYSAGRSKLSWARLRGTLSIRPMVAIPMADLNRARRLSRIGENKDPYHYSLVSFRGRMRFAMQSKYSVNAQPRV